MNPDDWLDREEKILDGLLARDQISEEQHAADLLTIRKEARAMAREAQQEKWK